MASAESITAIQKCYIAYYGRPADPIGLEYWANRLDNEGQAAIINAFGNSAEATSLYTGQTTAQMVNSIYQMLFTRDAEVAGLTYYVNRILSGQSTLATVMLDVLYGATGSDATAVANKLAAANAFTGALDTTPEILAYAGNTAASSARTWLAGVTSATTTTPDPAATIAAIVSGGGIAGQTFTLTAGIDNIVGTSGNDTITGTNTATVPVLGGLDSVDGGAGTDTLSVADTATAAGADFSFPAGFAVKNVEILNVSTNGAIGTKGGTAFDVSGFTGLTSATLIAAGAGTAAGSNIKAAGTTDVKLTVGGVNQIDIAGGKVVTTTNGGVVNVTGSALTSVTVNKAGVGGVTIDNTSVAGATSVGTTLTGVTLTAVDANSAVKGAALTNLTIGGATTAARTVTLTNGTAAHSLTVNAAGTGYNALGTVEFQTVVVDTVATSATVNTSATSSLDLSGATAVKALTLTGAGNLKLAPMGATTVSIDGSAATGNLNLGTLNAAALAVKTGAGNDTFTATSAASKLAIDSGAGNDSVTLAGTALVAGSTINLGAGDDHLIGTTPVAISASATSVINGGDGTDTVSAALINAGNAALYTGFEGLSLNSPTGLDLALLTGNTIGSLYIDAASTTATYQNVTAAMSLTDTWVGLNATVNTLGMTGVTGTADSYTITFAAVDTVTPVVANVGAGTIVAAGIENFNIVSGGTKAWNALTLGANTSANTVTITGAANLDLAFTGFGSVAAPKTGVSLIDGSAATGKLSINEAGITAAAAGITIKGGSAADTFITSTFASTLTGNAGADTFNVALTLTGSTAAPVITTITDAAATDKIAFVDLGTEVFNATKVNISTATALFGGTVNALDLAATGDGSVNAIINWFQYGGNTYIIEDVSAAATFTTADVVVKLTGLVDLSTAGNASTHILTLA